MLFLTAQLLNVPLEQFEKSFSGKRDGRSLFLLTCIILYVLLQHHEQITFPKVQHWFLCNFFFTFLPPSLAQGSPIGNLWKAETKDDCPKIVSAFEILSRGPSLSVGTSSELFQWGNILSSIGSLHGVWELLSFPRFAHSFGDAVWANHPSPEDPELIVVWEHHCKHPALPAAIQLTVSWCISECIRLKLRLPFCC